MYRFREKYTATLKYFSSLQTMQSLTTTTSKSLVIQKTMSLRTDEVGVAIHRLLPLPVFARKILIFSWQSIHFLSFCKNTKCFCSNPVPLLLSLPLSFRRLSFFVVINRQSWGGNSPSFAVACLCEKKF
jgi:hypothetical protein